MGMPIIGHLVRAGFPVLVYDVDPGKKDPVTDKGATFVTESGDIARQCSTVLVCVGYEEQLDDLMLGDGGVLGQLPQGALVAVLSTVAAAM
jgi:3-hydroxyisobutyrate dehydrogenase